MLLIARRDLCVSHGVQLDIPVSPAKMLLISIILFASASPLFEGAVKTVVAAAVAFVLIVLNRQRVRVSISATLSFLVVVWVFGVHPAFVDALHGYVYGWKGFGFLATVMIAFVVANLISKSEFLYVNERMIFFATVVGVPLYVAAMIYPEIIEALPFYTYGPYVHRTAGVVNFLYVDGLLIRRFTGFASEPGLASMFYLWALWYRISNRGGRLDWQSVLIILAMVLMQSTAGMIVLGLFMLAYVRRDTLLFCLVVVVPLIMYFAGEQIEYHIANKLIGSASFDIRYSRYFDFFARDWSDLLFGVGNGLYDDVLANNDLGGWDSLLQVGQRYGFLTVFVLFVLLLINSWRYLGVALIIIVTFASQSIWLMPAVAIFYFRDMNDC